MNIERRRFDYPWSNQEFMTETEDFAIWHENMFDNFTIDHVSGDEQYIHQEWDKVSIALKARLYFAMTAAILEDRDNQKESRKA